MSNYFYISTNEDLEVGKVYDGVEFQAYEMVNTVVICKVVNKSNKVYKVEVLDELKLNGACLITDKFRVIEEVDISDLVKFDDDGNVIWQKFIKYKKDEVDIAVDIIKCGVKEILKEKPRKITER